MDRNRPPKRKTTWVSPPAYKDSTHPRPITNQASLDELRMLNNRFKNEALQVVSLKGAIVLDLGAGKGGDLWKFLHAQISSYIGIDMNTEFIREFHSRLSRAKQETFQKQGKRHKLEWPEFHLFAPLRMQDTPELQKELATWAPMHSCDVVTSFFSLHGMFESVETLRALVATVTTFLKPKTGLFICTFMDGTEILKWMKELGTSCVISPDNFKLSLTSPDAVPDVVVFGQGISVEMNAQTVPEHLEYLTSFPLLCEAMATLGLVPLKTKLMQAPVSSTLASLEKRLLETTRYAIFKFAS